MSNGRSTADLLRFLDYLAEKGLMPSATAGSRKASANKMLAVLSEEESADVTIIDMEDVALRFHNKNGQQYTPGSIQTYKSRVSSAIDDFRSYLNNPLGFRISSKPRQRAKGGKDKTESTKLIVVEPAVSDDHLQYQSVAPSPSSAMHILPVALRPNLTIQIAGLPFDLTEGEAKKLANIILAHAIQQS